ncbi:hypothetical protein STRIP9103_00528 [Streptomyces ipomoeae 91-03]|uniref:Uncharacterized protein n=1 Tax=Streptomyces ipomoeae 91-03 TaxID=698759 RepID=L1KMI8_9ACTN|nr:hypothetical protein STRIP9103_00528 [Streptomyces ipomoeae 91-03]
MSPRVGCPLFDADRRDRYSQKGAFMYSALLLQLDPGPHV